MTETKIRKWCNAEGVAGFLCAIGITNTIVATIIAADRLFTTEKGRELEAYAKLPLVFIFYILFLITSHKGSGCRKADRKGHALLHIWAWIVMIAQLLYLLVATFYDAFVEKSEEMILELNSGPALFRDFYNASHGYKYLLMYALFMLGLIISRLLVRRIWIILLGFAFSYVYYYSFTKLAMYTAVIGDKSVGIVWTAVLYHGMQTCGFLCLGVYLLIKTRIDRNRYRKQIAE